ncbi:hypothetical protein NIES2104_11210 [Leptolyngbya sp. NIES-2104]|nr:hypothetical protein NIES2104_11210 [Leptolyngbya sp. NIES-2104]
MKLLSPNTSLWNIFAKKSSENQMKLPNRANQELSTDAKHF